MLKKIGLAVALLFGSFLSYPAAIAESPKQVTYLALGDSLTAGLGSTEENYLRIHGFVPQFTKYLRTKHDTVLVENHGIPGLTSTGLLALLQADETLRNRLKTANIVSVSIGGNDFLQTIRAFPNSDDEGLKLRMQILHGSIEEIHTLLKQLNPDATIMLIGLYNPYPSGHDLHELGTEYTPKYNEMLEKLTTGTTMVINPYDVFNTRESELTHINEGDIHPTNQGYKEIVNLMKKTYSD